MKNNETYSTCNNCTILLVKRAYEKSRLFRIIREPLRLGMSIMGTLYGIDPTQYPVRNAQCRGCLRFMKTALKERSAPFRALNALINPLFDRAIERIVGKIAVMEAKTYAIQSTHMTAGAGGIHEKALTD
ncbi:MAG TPA: nitroreductase [Spirochaetota bacterium]|nr:nitroreductase [Spirochaetota bacterium]HPV39710.1 nitroreductase [Spirochaetota bacterium]